MAVSFHDFLFHVADVNPFLRLEYVFIYVPKLAQTPHIVRRVAQQ